MPSLESLVSEKRVLVCVGCGGVGKTTTAAALALRAASRGRRALCLTIDPAKRLANAIGLGEMRAEIQEVPPERFTDAGLPLEGSGALHAMMLDTKRTFDELVERYAPTPEARDRILKNRLYQYVTGSLAGTQEYMALEKLYAIRADPRFDLLVLDTPPTPNALDFLDAPDKVVRAIDSPATRWMVRPGIGAGLGRMLGRGAAFILRALSRFTGAGFLEDLASFITDLNALFGGFRERAMRVAATLRSADVSFVVVTSPDPLAVDEAIFFVERLAAAQMPFGAVVANRVHRSPGALLAAQEIARRLGDGVTAPASSLAMHVARAAADEDALARADARRLERLRAGPLGRGGIVVVPELDDEVHDLRSLGRVAQHLFDAAADTERDVP